MREPSVRRYSGRPVEEWLARRERLLAAALEASLGPKAIRRLSGRKRLCTQAKVSTPGTSTEEFQNKEAVLLAARAGDGFISSTGDAALDRTGRAGGERIEAAVDSYLHTIGDGPRAGPDLVRRSGRD